MIEIFDFEKKDGLEELIKSTASIAYHSQLTPIDPVVAQAIFADKLTSAAASLIDINDPSLFYMEDVMVSTGENKNADFFEPLATWTARHSPVNKPLNFEHDEFKIIGHIVASQAVDENYDPIPEDTKEEDLPDKFHIINGSVIYLSWSDEDQNELITDTIEEIKDGEWFVSMECLFQGFDYVITDADGEQRVIARTKDTAFLTKYLRQYKGSGVYKNKSDGKEYKVARLLKNILFTGKGLVRKPANPESIIFAPNKKTAASENLGYVHTEPLTSIAATENESMPEVNSPEVKLLQDRIVALETENKSLKEHEGQAVKAQIDSLTTASHATATENNQLKTQNEALKETVNTLTARAEAAEAELKTAKAELTSFQAESIKASRLASLIEKGVAKEQASSFVDKFAGLTDEQFAELATILSAAFKKDVKDDDDNDEDDKNKEEAAKKKAEMEEEEAKKKAKKDKASAGTSAIDNAAPVHDPLPNSSATSADERQSTRASVAEYLQENFLRYNK